MYTRGNITPLEQQTIRNYQAAINYYAQKKINFLKMIADEAKKTEVQALKIITDKFNKDINSEWDRIYKSVLDKIDFIGESKYKSGFKYTVKEGFEKLDIPLDMKERIIKGQQNLNLYSLLGFEKEKFLVGPLNEVISEIVSAGYAEAMSPFNLTGNLTSKSFMRRGAGLSIRADIAMGLSDKADSSGVLREKGGNLSAELQEEFSLEEVLNKNLNIQENTLIQSYLKSGMYGVSVKLWSMSNEKPYTQAVGIRNIVNNTFNSSGRKTWNLNYAMATTNKIVSNYLIDVMGPINIALLDGKGITWSDEFLSSHLFTMNTYAKNNKIYKNNEVHPEVRDSNIVLRNFNMGRTNLQNILSDEYSGKIASKSYKITYRLNRVK